MELRKLRAEARSVERYRELNKGMEVKLMQLQLRVDQQVREEIFLQNTGFGIIRTLICDLKSKTLRTFPLNSTDCHYKKFLC